MRALTELVRLFAFAWLPIPTEVPMLKQAAPSSWRKAGGGTVQADASTTATLQAARRGSFRVKRLSKTGLRSRDWCALVWFLLRIAIKAGDD